MSHIPYHPAPGLNDLAPGWFALPQNPLEMGQSTVLVPSIRATAPGSAIKYPSLADLVAASFVVPQNPIRQNLAMSLAGLRGMGCGGAWGCSQLGCDGGQDFYALNGMGDLGQVIGTDPVSQFLATNLGSPGTWLADQSTIMSFTLPNWGWGVAGFALVYVASDLFSKGNARAKGYAKRYASS